MKLGIDTFGCDHARSGLGAYLLSFASNIPEESDVKTEFFGSELDRFTYTSGKDLAYTPLSVTNSLSSQRFWHFTQFNKFAVSQKFDCVVFPAPERVLPVKFKVPGIAVVNSVLSSQVEGRSDWIQKLQVKRGLNRVNKIIAASKFIRDDLIIHGIDENKIDVVYNGIDHKLFYPPIEIDSEMVDVKPFSIRKPYFIYGTALSGAGKKHIELIKAFSLFKEKTGLPHRLVISGDGIYASEVHKAAFESKYASDIFLTGYFPHESFAQLYSGSEACIFPSIEEGVGLPILEAMATGVPVICSSKGVLPEVGGKACLYFDADNIEEMSSCMEKVVSDKEIREKLIKNGLERSAIFNWENTVRETFQIAKNLSE